MGRTPLHRAVLLLLLVARAAVAGSPDATLEAAQAADAEGKTERAAELYAQAVAEAVALGERHELFSTTLFAAATFQELNDRPQEAVKTYRLLVDALERTGAAEVVSAYEMLAELLCARDAHTEVVALFDRSIARQVKAAGSADHPEVANSYRDLGRCLAEGGHTTEAAAAFDKQLAMREKLHGKGSPGTIPALMESASFHADAGDTARARQLLLAAKEALGEATGSGAELLEPTRAEIEKQLAALP